MVSVQWRGTCLCVFGRRDHEEQFCVIIFEFGPVVKEEMLFKDISYQRALERNHLCKNGRGHHDKQL